MNLFFSFNVPKYETDASVIEFDIHAAFVVHNSQVIVLDRSASFRITIGSSCIEKLVVSDCGQEIGRDLIPDESDDSESLSISKILQHTPGVLDF